MGSCGSHEDRRDEDGNSTAYKPSSAEKQAPGDEDKIVPGLGRRADGAVENRTAHEGAILGIARCGWIVDGGVGCGLLAECPCLVASLKINAKPVCV